MLRISLSTLPWLVCVCILLWHDHPEFVLFVFVYSSSSSGESRRGNMISLAPLLFTSTEWINCVNRLIFFIRNNSPLYLLETTFLYLLWCRQFMFICNIFAHASTSTRRVASCLHFLAYFARWIQTKYTQFFFFFHIYVCGSRDLQKIRFAVNVASRIK